MATDALDRAVLGPALLLVRLAGPAPAGRTEDWSGHLGPELVLRDAGTAPGWPRVAAELDQAGSLPWALLAPARTGPAALRLARQAADAGRPPGHVVLWPAAEPAAATAELTAARAELAAAGGQPLPCPVTVLLTAPDGRETEGTGGWHGLTAAALTVRMLPSADPGAPTGCGDGTAARSIAIARTVKEELQVWPA